MRDVYTMPVRTLGEYLYGCLTGVSRYLPNCSPLWFLMSMFVSYVYFCVILASPTLCGKLLRATAFVFLNAALAQFGIRNIPLHLETSLYGAAFLGIGLVIRKCRLLEQTSPAAVAVLFACSCISIRYNSVVDLNYNYLGIFPLYWCACVGISFTILYAMKRPPLRWPLLSYLGQHTIFLMGFNNLLNDVTSLFGRWLDRQGIVPFNWVTWTLYVTAGFVGASFVWTQCRCLLPQKLI